MMVPVAGKLFLVTVNEAALMVLVLLVIADDGVGVIVFPVIVPLAVIADGVNVAQLGALLLNGKALAEIPVPCILPMAILGL